MKHNLKITAILIAMFVITQFIGIYVVNFYSVVKVSPEGQVQNITSPNKLPYGMEPPSVQKETDFWYFIPSLIFAFVIAIAMLFILMRFKAELILKLWFFLVVVIALALTFNSFFPPSIKNASLIALAIAFPLGVMKIFGRNFLVHNLTEPFIYPGIAAVFVKILNVWTVMALLIIISIYDMWAVWKSGIMQKMAKYQIDKLNIFSGFFIPYLSKKQRTRIKKMRKTLSKTELRKKKIRVNLAILGGGDVIFPIITAGVMLKTLGIWSAVLVIIGATLGLTYLFFRSEKKKFYPAMPFITTGIFIAIGISYLLF